MKLRISIFGVGLIGGSWALAMRHAGMTHEIIGCSRSENHLAEAKKLGVIDRYTLDPAEAVRDADVVILAVPLGAMQSVCKQIQAHLSPQAILTDVGSAKASVIEAVRQGLGEIPPRFVPGHPIAGTEKSGVSAAFDSLFDGRRVILTPLEHTDPSAVNRVRGLWELTGAQVELMAVEEHDQVLAATSHLPHILAFGLVDCLAGMREQEEIFRYAAGGFKDFTRIASSDPVMWRDICLANREAILKIMALYQKDLQQLTTAIEQGNGDELLGIFQRAKAARDRFCL
ncbi:prephenate dehydrogenase [Ectothiorhodosinus mongolicus]|uniref:prephenate dehydrogenase n=1 Tax=Ectothiorhodosinus mongolicus TaxID=233100 RepID=A0A1R3VNQ8_9GAMM|nr:prephenate dehydrogenase/arogenate dehydrogenase family protein [Ectothiorhodosinus mongolicus]ULX57729.1 prephenate dehydrogenase/arogenate dehydrogenase family protein [Ectothiorhodosinus mongolicus]SIT65585.1 prephenate dehydrogenase [Ectothiorhodosinus mongolicus]